MKASLGRITAVLAEPVEQVSEELIALINRNINPPEPVGENDVYVRAMYVVSDEINSFGGRFPADEHGRLCRLLIDSPVLAGHRKDKLPLGRNFHAVSINKDGRQWVKSYFYWLKKSDGASNLCRNIDGGIYKECSIGFTYFFPECSVCGQDIRRCEHQPLEKLTTKSVEDTVHFNYRRIERVLETSLVYRGALADTAVTKDLEESEVSEAINGGEGLPTICRLEKNTDSEDARLVVEINGRTETYLIRQFNLNRLRHHVRFIAEKGVGPFDTDDYRDGGIPADILARVTVKNGESRGKQHVLDLEGPLAGTYILRPVNTKGKQQWLFYKLAQRSGSVQTPAEESNFSVDNFTHLKGAGE
jgi:hypothetical protein